MLKPSLQTSRAMSLVVFAVAMFFCFAVLVSAANAATELSKVNGGQSGGGGYSLVLVADDGKKNDVSIQNFSLDAFFTARFDIVENGDIVSIPQAIEDAHGNKCKVVLFNTISCAVKYGELEKISISAKDQDDSIAVKRGKSSSQFIDQDGCLAGGWPVSFAFRTDISAGSGDDYVKGGCVSDYLFGGPGNDILIGNGDNSKKDTLDCGADSDQYLKDSGDLVSNCESLWVPNIISVF